VVELDTGIFSADSRAPLVLGCDTGLAHFGWAVARVLRVGFEPVAMGVISTEKSDAKLNVLASGDSMRRARIIATELRRIVERVESAVGGSIVVVCHESISLPRNAGSSAKIGMAFGVLAAFVGVRDVPVLEATPSAIKKAATGSGSASKREVADGVALKMAVAIEERGKAKLACPWSPLFANGLSTAYMPEPAAGDREHAWDAMGAILACADADVMRAVRPR
jgi:crossover junction endodeoxyribonuclease RuvC